MYMYSYGSIWAIPTYTVEPPYSTVTTGTLPNCPYYTGVLCLKIGASMCSLASHTPQLVALTCIGPNLYLVF